MKKIAIVDYNGGNLFSVVQACHRIGFNPIITNKRNEIMQSDGLILPGVGAFGYAMKTLTDLNLINCIKEFISSGKPFLGICLGFQLLFSESEEFKNCKGLNLIKGTVKKFNFKKKLIKVPQIGWNKIFESKSWLGTPLELIHKGEFMYFVHSYYANPENISDVLSITKYKDCEYCSSILRDNIFATQFHPEKSGEKGLTIYKQWSNLFKI